MYQYFGSLCHLKSSMNRAGSREPNRMGILTRCLQIFAFENIILYRDIGFLTIAFSTCLCECTWH